MNREGYNLRANSVTWNRRSGEVHANGDVRVVSPGGDVAYADSVQLEDTLKDGVVQNMLLVLADGGRLAATTATRRNGVTTLYHAAYTPCAVTTPEGCPKNPTWQINAVRVVHDPVRHRISYRGATLNLFGMPILGLPGLSHPDGSQGGGTRLPGARDPLRPAQRARAQRALLYPLRAQPRPHRSRRTSSPACCRCSRPNIAS